MDHHEFSPSRLEQFRLCPGSYVMQQGIPDEESEWAAEGTLLHDAVATGKKDGLNAEQIEMVDKCREFADSMIIPGSTYTPEQKFDIKDSDGTVLTYGTADAVIYDEQTKTLTVIDWKFGYTPVDNVNENIQLACYAVGAMEHYGVNTCDCWVFQPRLYRKSHHLFSHPKAVKANIKSIIKAATDDRMTLIASEKACRYCRARLNCPAFRIEFQKMAATKGNYDLSNIKHLEYLYDASKAVKSFINEIERTVKKVIEEAGSCGKYAFHVSDGAREIKDLNSLYSAVKDLVTPREFNKVCKVTLGKFETLVADKLVAEARSKGEKLTKTNARKQCYGMIADLITRGKSTKKIVECKPKAMG